MRKLILAALALAASTVAATATPIAGTYLVTSTSNPTITNIFASPFSFDLVVGTPQTFNLARIFENTGGSSTITAAFNFTAPVVGAGSVVAADLFSITGNARHDTLTPSGTTTVNFSDGTVLDITFVSASFDGTSTAYQGLIAPVTFSLVSGPTTREVTLPEPLTISLFSAGLVGAAALRRRKKQNNA